MRDGTKKKSRVKAGPAAGAMSRTRKSPSTSQEALEEVIRRRAYEIYLERGQSGDGELEDWLRAEKEFAGPRFRTTSST